MCPEHTPADLKANEQTSRSDSEGNVTLGFNLQLNINVITCCLVGTSFFLFNCAEIWGLAFFHLGCAALAMVPQLAGELLIAQLELVTIKATQDQRPSKQNCTKNLKIAIKKKP